MSVHRIGRPRALITGAAGFLGRHLALHLASLSYNVSGVGHGSWDSATAAEWGIRHWHASDIDGAALQDHGGNPDIVVHCAGGSSVGASFVDASADHARTVGSVAASLDFACRCARLPHFVYVSSAAVYGNAGAGPIPVSAPVRPVSPYGEHKAAAEELCRHAALENGLPVLVVRFFSLYGPGLRKQLLWDACGKLKGGGATFFGTGEEVRDWLHVDDAVRLLSTAAAVASPTCPIVNGGTGVGTTVRNVIADLAEVVNPRAEVRFLGPQRTGDPRSYIAGVREASAVGWSPEIMWQDGMREYAEWYMGRLVHGRADGRRVV